MKSTSEQKSPHENQKRGTQRVHQNPKDDRVTAFPGAETEMPTEAARAAKSQVAYWAGKVRPRILPNGKPTAEFYVRLKESGRVFWVNLNTANQTRAARAARDLWISTRTKGAAVAIEEFRPKSAPLPPRCCTVGEYIEAARGVATARPRSLAQYESRLRSVVAGVLGIDKDPARYAAKSAANAEWRARIDGTRLDRITPKAVRDWQRAEIAAVKDEIARKRREHSTASLVRNARALFAEAIVADVKKRLLLPEQLPFEGVAVSSTTRRFQNPVDPRELYMAALALDADTRAAFLLLVAGGLRRGEADLLPWSNLDLQRGTVSVTVTRWHTPKTEESIRTVPLSADAVRFFGELRAAAPGDEFVLKGAPPRVVDSRYEYRAQAWGPLMAWLRAQGVTDPNPLHSLRKLSGSFIYSVAGIEAARRHLGHRTIATTAASYLAGAAAVVDLGTVSAAQEVRRA